MSQWIELNGLKRFWNAIKDKFKPACQHTNISSLITISWCLGEQEINCCSDDIQKIYICKDCGQIKVISAQICGECCGWDEQEKWDSCLNQWVDPTLLLPWSKIQEDSLYTAQYIYSTPDAKNFGDYVIEKGTLNGWTYHKWNSGLLELWIDRYSSSSSFNSSMTNKSFVIHYDTDTIPFLQPYNCIVSCGVAGQANSSMCYHRISHSSSMSPAPSGGAGYYLDTWIWSTGGTQAYWIKAYVTAKWK